MSCRYSKSKSSLFPLKEFGLAAKSGAQWFLHVTHPLGPFGPKMVLYHRCRWLIATSILYKAMPCSFYFFTVLFRLATGVKWFGPLARCFETKRSRMKVLVSSNVSFINSWWSNGFSFFTGCCCFTDSCGFLHAHQRKPKIRHHHQSSKQISSRSWVWSANQPTILQPLHTLRRLLWLLRILPPILLSTLVSLLVSPSLLVVK